MALLPELGMLQLLSSSGWAPSCQNVTPGCHAGVVLVSPFGAPPSLPTIVGPFLAEFGLGRAMRDVLPLGNGNVAHLHGNQEDQLLTFLLAEAEMCCFGRTVILMLTLWLSLHSPTVWPMGPGLMWNWR